MPGDTKYSPNGSEKVDRRKFLGAAAAAAGMLLIKPELVRGTAANSTVRVALLGCGGRGTEDATNMIDTGGARVVALGDLFQDQLDKARDNFNKIQQDKGYPSLDASQRHTAVLSPAAFGGGDSSRQTCLSRKASGRGRARRIESNRNRKTRPRKTEPGRRLPDSRLPSVRGNGKAHSRRRVG